MKLQGQATKGGGEDDKGTSNAEQSAVTHSLTCTLQSG